MHLSLEKDAPQTRPVQPPELGSVVGLPEVGELHHRYDGGRLKELFSDRRGVSSDQESTGLRKDSWLLGTEASPSSYSHQMWGLRPLSKSPRPLDALVNQPLFLIESTVWQGQAWGDGSETGVFCEHAASPR